MKILISLYFAIFSTMAYAGFIGYNGGTSLGVANKLVCSTGLTCTKTADSFSIVSTPSVTSGAFNVVSQTGVNATIDIQSDLNAANGDDWQLSSLTNVGGFTLSNNANGSQVPKITVTTAGNTTVAGTLTATGATSLNGGVASGTATRTRWAAWIPGATSQATSATPSATVLYLTQIWIPHNATLTGVGVLNAATVGTNKYVVALFNSSGVPVANSSTAGVLTSGASAFQQVPFTATYSAVGPRTYWIGIYMNGTTDRYFAIPTLGQSMGLAGSVSGQTFGSVTTVVLPTTFTADIAPVAYVY